MKRFLITLLLLLFTSSIWAQLNEYKYIIVPTNFEFFKEENAFQTSTLIKYLFTQSGFNAVYDNDLPVDLYQDPCLGATVNLERISKLARTRITIVMKDCNGNVIFRSIEGASKSKDFREAYHQSIRESFVPFANMGYEYKPAKKEEETITVSYADDIKEIEEKKEATIASDAAVVQIATPDEQLYESNVPEPSDYVKSEPETTDNAEVLKEDIKEVYQAKELPNGYELLRENDQVWLTLYETSSPDVYLARNDQQNGMVYKKDSKWYFEFYKDSDLVVQEISIDFQ